MTDVPMSTFERRLLDLEKKQLDALESMAASLSSAAGSWCRIATLIEQSKVRVPVRIVLRVGPPTQEH